MNDAMLGGARKLGLGQTQRIGGSLKQKKPGCNRVFSIVIFRTRVDQAFAESAFTRAVKRDTLREAVFL